MCRAHARPCLVVPAPAFTLRYEPWREEDGRRGRRPLFSPPPDFFDYRRIVAFAFAVPNADFSRWLVGGREDSLDFEPAFRVAPATGQATYLSPSQQVGNRPWLSADGHLAILPDPLPRQSRLRIFDVNAEGEIAAVTFLGRPGDDDLPWRTDAAGERILVPAPERGETG